VLPTPAPSDPSTLVRNLSSTAARLLRPVLTEDPKCLIYALPPNRDTLGGTAYLVLELGETGLVSTLVDCPAWTETLQTVLDQEIQLHHLFLTHRGAIGQASKIQAATQCKVVIQEQEAYLLPDATVTSFGQTWQAETALQAIWTPGHSPGSSCLYHPAYGGVLFTGRHLLPDATGQLSLMTTAKTFHPRRQRASLQKLVSQFTADTLNYLCPGANLGFLRGGRVYDRAYRRLTELADQLAH